MGSRSENVSVSVAKARVTIDFASLALPDEVLESRIDEVLPLLRSLIAADESWANLSEHEIEQRGNGIAAMDLMCQSATHAAVKQAELLQEIVEGRASIADHGFPEFG